MFAGRVFVVKGMYGLAKFTIAQYRIGRKRPREKKMGQPFNHWTDRIISAEDESSRNALTTEIIRWRAGCLSDIAKQRDAAYALARLYMLAGSHAQAVQEGQTLMSLCQMPPDVSKDEWHTATAFLNTLGIQPPKKHRRTDPRPKKKDRSHAPSKGPTERPPQNKDRFTHWVQRVIDGDVKAVRGQLKGKKGPQIQLMRAWMTAHEWSVSEPGPKRDALITRLEQRLRQQMAPSVSSEPQKRKKAKPSAEVVPDADKELVALLGQTIPRRRDSRVRLLEGFVRQNPQSADAVAAAALKHHVTVGGLEAPAPWFVSLVGHAYLNGDATATKAFIASLQDKNAVCAEPFAEETFSWCLEFVRLALGDGWSLKAWRRGVLPRVEAVDRKIWTIRLFKGEEERMIAVAQEAAEPYDDALALQLASRIAQLAKNALIVAPMACNTPLRDAAESHQVTCLDTAQPEEVFAAMLKVSPRTVERSNRKPVDTQVLDDVTNLLRSGALENPEQFGEKVAGLRRARDLFRCLEVVRAENEERVTPELLSLILRTMHGVVPSGSRILEGTTMAVQYLCQHESALVSDCLTEETLGLRYGGVGIEGVIDIARALHPHGWTVSRVLRGTTRRERRDDEILNSIGEGADEIWRLVMQNDAIKGEIVFMKTLSPEGRAALPQLLRVPRNRLVVLPVEPDILEWYRQTDGPEPLGWTGEEASSLPDALGEWSA